MSIINFQLRAYLTTRSVTREVADGIRTEIGNFISNHVGWYQSGTPEFRADEILSSTGILGPATIPQFGFASHPLVLGFDTNGPDSSPVKEQLRVTMDQAQNDLDVFLRATSKLILVEFIYSESYS